MDAILTLVQPSGTRPETRSASEVSALYGVADVEATQKSIL